MLLPFLAVCHRCHLAQKKSTSMGSSAGDSSSPPSPVLVAVSGALEAELVNLSFLGGDSCSAPCASRWGLAGAGCVSEHVAACVLLHWEPKI